MEVRIPAFEIESKISFNQILNKLGITDIFYDGSISNILSHPCHINNFLHSTKINADQPDIKKPFNMYLTKEERLKLAEEIGYEPKLDFEEWKRLERDEEKEIDAFNADHPFIYFVTLVNESVADLKSILLMGKHC